MSMKKFTRLSFIYLRVLHDLHCAVKSRAQWSKADHNIHLRVLSHCIGHVLIDRQEDLFVAPVKLLLVITTRQRTNVILSKFQEMVNFKWFNLLNLRERVDHSCHRGFISGANVVKVQHALNSTRLHAPNNGLCLFSEECGGFGWRRKSENDIRAGNRGKDCYQEQRRWG